MSAPFDGPGRVASDLWVGEIRALRTFRLSLDGSLLPVAHDTMPWSDGRNTARCNRNDHAPAAPGCSCGFYAYGTLAAASQHPEARRLLAVVACWGRVVPGTLGLRAQHARIEALWVSHEVLPQDIALIRSRYPSVALYHSSEKMIRQHRPTRLDSYEPHWKQSDPPRRHIPDQLSTRARTLTGLVITAFVGSVSIGVTFLITVLWHLLRHVF